MRRTKVKDFRKGADQITAEDRRFLQQYRTLTKCDLYFSDKAILVEAATERILMPRITKIVDVDLAPEHRLGRQYVTTIEAGGAHAQVFYPLLEYLELKTPIITDIDAVKLADSRWKKRDEHQPFVHQYPAIIRYLGYEPWSAPVSLGDGILGQRIRRGLSIRRAAKIIGVDPAAFGPWESGAWQPEPRSFQMISDFT